MRRAALLLLAALASPAAAQRADLVIRDELRVCADPANLPFSNQQREGFENRIAQIIADDLGLPLAYVWFPQVIGFVRNTLNARQCDLIMGTVSSDTIVDTTGPYYHTAYMIVTRASDPPPPSLGDPAMTGKRIGIVAATPPTALLLKHDLMRQVRSYALAVDTRHDAPARSMLQDLVNGEIDVALVWGPIAGYAIAREGLPLRAELLEPEPGTPRLDYRISMGVRVNEPEWRRRINQAVQRHQAEITAVLREYGVPLLDEQGRLVASP